MSRNSTAGVGDRHGLKKSTPHSPFSSALSPVCSPTILSEQNSEAQNQQELLEWLKTLGFESHDIDKPTLRIIQRGPFKDFLYNFCLPSVRTRTWITTMRLNLDLADKNCASSGDLNEETFAKADEEIAQHRTQLEELEQTEEKMLERLNSLYVYREDTSLQSLLLPQQRKIMKEVERKLLGSLRKSLDLRNDLFKLLASLNSRTVNNSLAIEGVDQLENPKSMQEFSDGLRKLIPKYLGDEINVRPDSPNEDLTEDMKRLKQIVQTVLGKLNAENVNALLKSSNDVTEALISKLPYNEFSTGLSKFNKIIGDKLLEWSALHISLHEANFDDLNDLYQSSLCETTICNSNNGFSDTVETPDEIEYLKLLMGEDQELRTLEFYQDLNIDEYEKLVMTQSNNDNCDSPALISKTALNGSANGPPTLLNYELLTEKLLMSLPAVRNAITDGMRWANGTFGGEISQCFEATIAFLTEDLKPIN